MASRPVVEKATLHLGHVAPVPRRGALRAELAAVLRAFGDVVELRLAPRGQAFATYTSPVHAARARLALDGALFRGKKLVVEFAHANSKAFARYDAYAQSFPDSL